MSDPDTPWTFSDPVFKDACSDPFGANAYPAHVSGIPAMDSLYVFTNMNPPGESAEIPAQPPMWWPVRNVVLAPNTSLCLMGDGTLTVSVREEPTD